jgi:hypothetical protein
MIIGCNYTKYVFGIRYRCYACIVIFDKFCVKYAKVPEELIENLIFTRLIITGICLFMDAFLSSGIFLVRGTSAVALHFISAKHLLPLGITLVAVDEAKKKPFENQRAFKILYD